MKANSYFDRHLFQPLQLKAPISSSTGIITVIPCYNEPDVMSTLRSLDQCDAPQNHHEVIIVINAPADASQDVLLQNEKTFQAINTWNSELKNHIHIIRQEELPLKFAGVGLARKIGMDEAAFRFESIGKKDGVIICLDADCTVAENYLTSIEQHYQQYPDTHATSIYFEHPLLSDNHVLDQGIIYYELHLRYFVEALRYAGYPFAAHTIGSSMTVRSDIYQLQGGMNKRKAGEDFYFLHKIMPLGNFYEINDTCVFPSPRLSDRVPFGTGKAMQHWMEDDSKEFHSYNPLIFEDLKKFIQEVDRLYEIKNAKELQKFLQTLPHSIGLFLESNKIETVLDEIQRNTANLKTFRNRFFRWYNGLKMLKSVHFLRTNFYPNLDITKAATSLLNKLVSGEAPHQEIELLYTYRTRQRKSLFTFSF